MVEKNRREDKTREVPVYKFERIRKATKLKVKFIPQSTFKTTDEKNKEHYVSMHKKTRDWTCDCWYFANRTAPNKERWGYCSHILAVLYKFSPSKFREEANKKVKQNVKN